MTSEFAVWAINGLSFFALTLAIAAIHEPILFHGFDGTYILQFAKEWHEWGTISPVLVMDFLKGIGDLQMPILTRLTPDFELSAFLAGSDVWPYGAFTIVALLCFGATGYLCKCLGATTGCSLAAAWLGCLLVLPYFVPPLTHVKLWGSPFMLVGIAEIAAAGGLFVGIGAGSMLDTGLRAVAILALSVHLIIALPFLVPMMLPTAALLFAVALWSVRNRTELVRKLVVAAALAGVLGVLFAGYLHELFAYSPPPFFWQNMATRAVTLNQFTFFTHPDEAGGWPGLLTVCIALVGALVASIQERRRTLGRAAIMYLVFVGGLFATAVALWLRGTPWGGPSLGYFDMVALPLVCLFVAYAGATVGKQTVEAYGHIRRWKRAALGAAPTAWASLVSLILIPVVPWAALALAHQLDRDPSLQGRDPYAWPPQETPIVAELKQEIGLAPGVTFRGRVATLAGVSARNPVGAPGIYPSAFSNQNDFDTMIDLPATGNEHRYYGLWYFDIPTLQSVNQFLSPFLYLVTARYLAPPGTRLEHQHLTITEFNPRIMQLLGVSYVIDDVPIESAAAILVKVLPLRDGRVLRLYRVDDPNLGGYSPTHFRQAGGAVSALAAMDDPSLDLRQTVIAAEKPGPDLVSAQGAKIQVDRNGLHLSAQSEGTSVLVLPVEYSRCLRLRPANAKVDAHLFRADLLLAGVAFSGRLDATLSYRFGPFTNRGCRYDDLADAYRLGIGTFPIWASLNR